MEIACKTCSHASVCKFKDSYENIACTLDVDIPTPLSLDIKCSQYNFDINYGFRASQETHASSNSTSSTKRLNVSIQNAE